MKKAMVLSAKEIAQFQRSQVNAMTQILKAVKPGLSQSESFEICQKLQMHAIRFFECSKGSVPENWLSDAKEA